MVTNAQLDNTITTQMFQLELLKEQIEEKDESIVECQREYKSKSRVSTVCQILHEHKSPCGNNGNIRRLLCP